MQFNPTAVDFEGFEAALHSPINEGAREKLCMLVNRYCARVDAENGGGAGHSVTAVARSITALNSKILALGPATVAGLDARLKDRIFSRRGSAEAVPDALVNVALVSALLLDLKRACHNMGRFETLSQEELRWIDDEIERRDRPERGRAPYTARKIRPFERLVIELTTWARVAKLSWGISNTGAAKHQSGEDGFLLSPFAAFLIAILALVPEKYRLNNKTGEAMQKGIQRARTAMRRKVFPLPDEAMTEGQIGLGTTKVSRQR